MERMINELLNKDAYNYYLGYQEKFIDITNRSSTLSNINHCGYLRVYYKDSKYFYASSDPKVTKEYLMSVEKSNIFFNGLIANSTKEPQYHFLLWPKTPTDLSMEIYFRNNYWHGFTIANTTNSEYIELWWFASNLESDRIYHYYLEKKAGLLQMTQQFHYSLKDIIKFDGKILASYPKGFTFNTDFGENTVSLEHQYNSSKNIPKNGLVVKARNGIIARLTPRRVETLIYHAEGMSVKQIANHLAIHEKTAEKHLRIIQQITGYNLRSDLTKMYNDQIRDFMNL